MSENSAPEKEKKQQNILNYMGKRKESPTSTSLNPNNEEKNPVPVSKKLKLNSDNATKKQESEESLINIQLNRKSMKKPESVADKETNESVRKVETSNSSCSIQSDESKTSSEGNETKSPSDSESIKLNSCSGNPSKSTVDKTSAASEDPESDQDGEVLSEDLRKKYRNTYKFLDYDDETKKIYCSWCRKRGFFNALSRGKKFLFDKTIVQHIAINQHSISAKLELGSEREKGQQSLDDMMRPKLNIEDKDLVPLFRNVYFLAKENIALRKCENLNLLSDINGTFLNKNYRGELMAKQFLTSIASKIRVDVLSDLQASPYIGLQADESTDVTFKPQLAIAIQYIANGEVKSKFIDMIELDNQSSEEIFNKIWKFLTMNNLNTKLIALAVDGASAMISDQNGLYGRLKKNIPKLIVNHCCIHRLSLALKSLGQYRKPKDMSSLTEAQKSELAMKIGVKKFNTNIHTLVAFFTTSSKRLKILEEQEIELLDTHLRLRKPLDVR